MPSDPRLSCVKQAEILHKDFDSYCSPQSLLRGLWFVYIIIIACPYNWVSWWLLAQAVLRRPCFYITASFFALIFSQTPLGSYQWLTQAFTSKFQNSWFF